MKTPQQALESFMSEKAAVYSEANVRLAPIYNRYLGEPLSNNADDFLLTEKPHIFESVTQSEDSAVIIARQDFNFGQLWTRYHLTAISDDWKIVGIEMQCFLCKRTGRTPNGKICRQCGGSGFYDRRKPKGTVAELEVDKSMVHATSLSFMNSTTKRALIAGGVATVLMFVLGTPDIITQLIIFMPSFVITFVVLTFLFKKKIQKP